MGCYPNSKRTKQHPLLCAMVLMIFTRASPAVSSSASVLIPIALLAEVWVSLCRKVKLEAGHPSVPPGQNKSNLELLWWRGEREVWRAVTLWTPRGEQSSAALVKSLVSPGEGKRRERIPKGPLPAVAHSTGCSEQSQFENISYFVIPP